MIIQAKTTKQGLIKPLHKVSLPEGVEFTIIIDLPIPKKEIEDNNKPKIKPGRGLGTLKKLSKLDFKGGPRDLSKNIDKYLYAD